MNKKAQVTLFIILGIVILITAGFLLYIGLGKVRLERTTSIPQQIRPINNFVENCIKGIGLEVLYSIGQQGGYYKPDLISTEMNTAYFYYENEKTMPTEKRIEKEISDGITSKLPYCIKDFADFPDFEIKSEKILTNTIITENKVSLNIDYPLKIKKGNIVYKLSKFNVEVPIKLKKIYKVSENIIDEQIKNPEHICLSCLLDLGAENNLDVDFVNYGGDTIIFIITDKTSMINNLPYEFKFAYELK